MEGEETGKNDKADAFETASSGEKGGKKAKKSESKAKKCIKYLIFVAVAAVLIALVMLFTKKAKASDEEDSSTPVVIQQPVNGNLTESVTISGYVEAKVMIPVVPFVQGTITEYSAKAGDFVEKDTVLAQIDDAPYRQTLLQAQAAFDATESTFQRIESLYKSGATTQQNYDSVKAQRDASKAQYDLAKLQYDYCSVKSPVDGTVLVADLAVGSIGTTSSPVAVIADLNDQVVRLKVPEKYYDMFILQRENLVVKIIRPADSNMYEDAVTSATIENIAPYVSAESKTFQVVCHLDEPGERFRPGMYVKVNVAYRTFENVPLLKMQTKKLDGSCYIYHPDTTRVSYVELEDIASDGEYFVVPEEYRNSWFVTDGQYAVFDGQKVSVIDGEIFK